MNRIQKLETTVRQQYAKHDPNRADWADWLGDNHVFIVADNASQLTATYGGQAELARAAALLHDIADTVMSRFADDHEAASLEMARGMLQRCEFSNEEIAVIVDDAIRWHGCHDGKVPATIEGKILATADSQAHLQTDFYIFATWAMAKDTDLASVKAWVLKKIDRDFHNKILFPEVKEACQVNYEALKTLYSR